MTIINLINTAENTDIISLKNLDASEKILDLYKDIKSIPDSILNRFWSIYFKIYLSKNGFKKTLTHLDEIDGINTINLAAIGSEICKLTGNYDVQKEYLNKFPVLSYPWVEREKIRCMTSLGELDDATSWIYKLIEFKPTLFNEFAVDFFWKVNLWEDMYNHSNKLDMEYLKNISLHALKHLNNGNNKFLDVISIYNSNTIDQINLQKAIFPRSLMNAIGSEGVAINLLPMSSIKKLTDNSSHGILGAALAHLKTIEKFYSTGNDFAVITESDSCVFRPLSNENCEAALESYDFILCAESHVTSEDKLLPMDTCNDYIFKGRAAGFYGYIINRKSASMILEKYSDEKINKHIDGDIISWASSHPELKVGYMSHPIFGRAYSSIFSTRAKVELGY